MVKKKREIADNVSDEVMKRIRRSRALIAKELPELIEKDQCLHDAMRERTTSGALRRAIHSSKILLPDLADRAQSDIDTLDAFLIGEWPLTSDVIDRLTKILGLKLERERFMTTSVTGVVSNGVIVPNSPLPEGTCVEIQVKPPHPEVPPPAMACCTPSELRSMLRSERQAILAAAAALAEEDYRDDKELTGFDAFSEEEVDDDKTR